jgi:AbrB family looped-hinge helix DNA binding protein
MLTPLIKVIRHGQITLPAEFREVLELHEGDYLEAELEKGKIVLKPAVVMNRAEAKRRLQALLDKVQARNEGISEEEVERDIAEAIQEVRREKRRKSNP